MRMLATAQKQGRGGTHWISASRFIASTGAAVHAARLVAIFMISERAARSCFSAVFTLAAATTTHPGSPCQVPGAAVHTLRTHSVARGCTYLATNSAAS